MVNFIRISNILNQYQQQTSMTNYDKILQENKNHHTQEFLNKVKDTKYYPYIRDLMKQWKQQKQKSIKAFTLFSRLVLFINNGGNKQVLDQLNKCLVKEATVPKINGMNKLKQMKERCKQKIIENNNSGAVLDKFINENQQKKLREINVTQTQQRNNYKYQQINEQIFSDNIQNRKNYHNIIKSMQLYLNCIINLKQFKQIIVDTLPKNQQIYLIQSATEIESSRRKSANFVPLNQLAETSFIERMGMSYVTMPDCYAHKCNDGLLQPQIKEVLNKKWVSVPLGSQHMSFIIMRKNTYEEQLFKNQDQKFEIDHTIIILRRALKQIQMIQQKKQFKGEFPLIQRVLHQIYGFKQFYIHLRNSPEIACIFRPRIQQKLRQLQKCRQRAFKQWEQVHIKNFNKSLDHRSFYFRKNDKKYNCAARWQKQIDFRMNAVNKIVANQAVQNRDNFNQKFNLTVDSFENVTKQKCLQQKQIIIEQNNNNSQDSFPKSPQNKVLFVMQFQNIQILKDLAMILYKLVGKKNILQFLMIKIFNINTKDIAEKENRNYRANMQLKYIESKINNKQTNDEIQDEDFLGIRKQKKKNMQEQSFEDLIQEQILPINSIQPQTTFEGPKDGRVFIGTKNHYYFIRYLLTIYQRFQKVKQMGGTIQDEIQQVRYSGQQVYELFKIVLVCKIKDLKFEEYLNKIFGKNSFLFFTLDKILLNLIKLINNFDELSNNIAKQDTKDYELQIRKYDKFIPKGELHQMLRIYHQNSNFFRFCYSNSILYISSWSSIYKNQNNPQLFNNISNHYCSLVYNRQSNYEKKTQNKKIKIEKKNESEYCNLPYKYMFIQKGEDYLNKRWRAKQPLLCELLKKKKIKFV